MTHLNDFAVGLAPPPERLHEHLRQWLKQAWKDYQKSFRRCRAKFSEASVHQLRIQSRRLLALLPLLEILVGPANIAPFHRRVKKVRRRLARLRDTQVQLLHVEEKLRSFPEAKPFRKALRERERRLIRRVGGRMHRARMGKIKAGIAAIRSEVGRVLAGHAREGQHWDALLGAVNQAVVKVISLRDRCREDDLETIHRLRIAFKKFRYMIELLQPVLPSVTQLELKNLRGVQNRLGEIQDANVLVAALDQFSRKQPSQAAAVERFRQDAERRRNVLVHGFLTGADRIHEFGLRHPARPGLVNGTTQEQVPDHTRPFSPRPRGGLKHAPLL